MKELITFVLKPLSFLPALAIMYIIYSFSGQTGEESGNLSYEVSVKIVEIGNQVLDKGLQDWEISEVAASITYERIFHPRCRSVLPVLRLRFARFSAYGRRRTDLCRICRRG